MKKQIQRFTVDSVVCDYGVFENGELLLIMNSYGKALQVACLLNEDYFIHRQLNPIIEY